ncbi:MAG TPA: hypothetical protein VHR18_01210 [Solirubrobacterales bacterium]|nr:hypothetical protein [Solirubrobacterales bacterium]
MEEEAPKVDALLSKAVTSYTLVTNVRGTGHADAGSIDKLDDLLQETLSVPARAWWRDDLVVRLKGTPSLRWEFPDLLSGLDVLRELLESDLSEERKRRSAAINAYLAEQYEEDGQVRFKQVDLLEDLLDLFVDIPAAVTAGPKRGRSGERDIDLLQSLAIRFPDGQPAEPRGMALEVRAVEQREGNFEFPATDLLLDSEFQEHAPLVVIEGAPGQGKSTITQYLCQVHRMRLLDMETSRLPEHQKGVPLRVPFRVDLRDLATWFQGRNPFLPDQELADQQPRSVEAFLAASVYHHSGGVNFDVADLLSVLETTAAVAVFDGLDEVADIETRQHLVDELTATARRLAATALSFQMIVTSRPAAFANSPGFDPKTFRYLTLEAITPSIAKEYSDKWIKARKLTSRDAREVKRVLETKLEEPHMRELARNTMQLTILLSLIYARGSSLPDKRTALYGAYIETFLNRESEKSEIVREHRELLISLHGYLAWILHSDTEQGSGSGRISADDLTNVLSDYLSAEGHDATLVDSLFEGVVTRVVAVVSRIEGLYEFEVQPLREYFAAQFLYDTARYSPTGEEVRGTLPDRFLALAKNPYWLNVARFYAGFWSKGEIPSLVESLKDLADDPDFTNLRQPRVLAAMLLADWVFNQNPRSLDDVVRLVADPIGVQLTMSNAPFRARDTVEVLPEGSGRRELADRCYAELEGSVRFPYARVLCSVIERNCPMEMRKQHWLSTTNEQTGMHRDRWITYGRLMGTLAAASERELDDLLGHPPADRELMELLASGRGRYVEADEHRSELTVEIILSGRWPFLLDDEDNAVINKFGQIYAYTQHPAFGARLVRSRPAEIAERSRDYDILHRCGEALRIWEEQDRADGHDWSTSLQPWEVFIEASRRLFGEQWAHSVLAIEGSGIKSTSDTARDAPELFDSDVPLARRVRYARLRAGNPGWWGRQLSVAGPGDERLLALGVLLSKASARTISAHIEQLDGVISGLPSDEFQRLYSVCSRGRIFRARSNEASALSKKVLRLPRDLSNRMVELVSLRAAVPLRAKLYSDYLQGYAGRRAALLEMCIEQELSGDRRNAEAWKRALSMIRRHPHGYYLRPRRRWAEMPIGIAREICSDAASFDPDLVEWAESRCFSAARVRPVSKVAVQERWFEAQ